jgi:predicted nucleic acid-binding protein
MPAPRRVVDTSSWVEWLTGSTLGKKLANEFPDKAACVVPTIVQLELSKWLLREVGEEKADAVKLATADAIVYATARHMEVDLMTCDAHFEGLPAVSLFPKR